VGLARAINVWHFVHQTIGFGFFDNGKGFFFGNLAAASSLNEVTGGFVKLHAHIIFKVTASFVHQTAGSTARAIGDRDVGRGVDIVRKLFPFLVIWIVFDGRFDRNDPHNTMANRKVASERHNALNGVFGKRLSNDRMSFNQFDVIDHGFHDSRNENRNVVAHLRFSVWTRLDFRVGGVASAKTNLGHLIQNRRNLLNRHLIHFRESRN